jgi:hypothetical protein
MAHWYNPSATTKMSQVSNQWCATGTPAGPAIYIKKYLKAKAELWKF